jgi:hypothetical protein
MCQIAAVKSNLGNAGVEYRLPAYHRVRVTTPFLDESTRIGKGMLAIGIDLQHMRKTLLARKAKTGQHRRTLAAINNVLREGDARLCAQTLELGGAELAATIVDEQYRQPLRTHACNDRADCLLVVVDRNDDAG